MANKKIVDKNFELMRSHRPGGMEHLLQFESMGGNAGVFDGGPCMAANFYYNPMTGEIKVFGNIQDIPREERAGYAENSFRIAIDLKTMKRKIISYGHNNIPKRVDGMDVKENIDQAVAAWNSIN